MVDCVSVVLGTLIGEFSDAFLWCVMLLSVCFVYVGGFCGLCVWVVYLTRGCVLEMTVWLTVRRWLVYCLIGWVVEGLGVGCVVVIAGVGLFGFLLVCFGELCSLG